MLVMSKPKSTTGTGLDSDEIVLTPGGWRPKSAIHRVEPGNHISAKDGRIRKIHTASGEVVSDYGEISHNKSGKHPVRTPQIRPPGKTDQRPKLPK
jgi:hypothetical protein